MVQQVCASATLPLFIDERCASHDDDLHGPRCVLVLIIYAIVLYMVLLALWMHHDSGIANMWCIISSLIHGS